ncbi:carbohydrate porin [Rheinheimera sp. UJ63]|uniref:carbohydrate porin n=1 Tax=Rheinheimera sp. UJ63 TaxID=2910157 RepID=UPI001F1E9B5C|nr:carbohydrate porin [Rheinheimera sp. UJ63]MCF4007842.1 carbohydrate porin [Rheinheimera sp. UJ63]
MTKTRSMVTLISAFIALTPLTTQASSWDFSGGVVLTHQQTDEQQVANETAASADLLLTKQQLSGSWVIHLEASSSPKTAGISRLLPEANTDAASALSKEDNGRFQLSELFYQHQFSDLQTLSVGLIDISGFFEQSRIASDEATQFLGAFFTGNPLIEFPDYTLGVVYEQHLTAGPVLRAAFASSNGLADNDARSYSQLLTVNEKDKGVFAITSISWRQSDYLFRLGVWANTAAHVRLDDSDQEQANYGLYLLAGYQLGKHAWNVRLGAANDRVSTAGAFAGVSYQFSHNNYVLGLAMARAYVGQQIISDERPVNADTQQYEMYLRYAITPTVFITADIQSIVNSDFTAAEDQSNRVSQVYGARLTWLFG